jgi:hypothetical protein
VVIPLPAFYLDESHVSLRAGNWIDVGDLRSSPQSNLRVEPLIQSASWSSTHSISSHAEWPYGQPSLAARLSPQFTLIGC